MAGDWIKMRVDLQDDPAVVALCDALGMDEYAVIGRLHKLWSWADKHTVDGVTSGVTPKWVDRYVNLEGFFNALSHVEWIAFDEGVLSLPGFEIHNGKSAKNRCDQVIRQRESRNRHAGVTNGCDARVAIPKPFMRAVLQRDDYTCVYCGTQSNTETESSRKSVLSVDHIIPHSRFGRQAIEDLATCCKACNREKSDRTPEEFGLLPKFLVNGFEYKNGMITVTNKRDKNVTNKRDKNVTKPLPEKIREDKSNNNTSDKRKKQTIDKPESVSAQVWSDWLVVRKTKRAGNPTETVLKRIEAQAKILNWPIEKAIEYAASKSWTGFEADWVKDAEPIPFKQKIVNFADPDWESRRPI